MQTDVLCHVAVSSATYAIDKPYTYLVPESLEQRIQPGMRVIVPFGTGNRRVEGLILDLFSGERKRGLKPVRALLDETPVLDPSAIKLALWMRERYFCTVYDADIVLMHLMGDDHTVDVRTDGGAEAPEIFPDAGRVIPLTEPQVQRIKGRGADAPKPGGEAVDCPQPLRTVEGHAGACHAFK